MNPPECTLILRPGREKSLRLRHPWIFDGSIKEIQGEAEPGATAAVRSLDGDFLAWAAVNPKSKIAARVWSWREDDPPSAAWMDQRVRRAAAARSALGVPAGAARIVNGESDGLPGVIIDRYGAFAVCQFLSAGAERWRDALAAAALALPGVEGVYERSEGDARAREGLEQKAGPLLGERPPKTIEIEEHGLKYLVDAAGGQKTGFYLDQRDNRRLAMDLAKGRRVLNAFCYSGAFSAAAWRGGAEEVVSLDSSPPAVDLARANLELNGLPAEGLAAGNVFQALREYRDAGRVFDFIVLDPPKFAAKQADVERASRAYKDINWLALRLLSPGGLLMTFSCSGAVDDALFQKIVFGAAIDAGREARIVRRLGPSADHPVALTFPEGGYLKGMLCQVLD